MQQAQIIQIIALGVTILLFICAIVGFFLKDFHKSMKETIGTLTLAINELRVVITDIKADNKHISSRIDSIEIKLQHYDKIIESFFKEYQSSLEFIKENLKILQRKILSHTD